MTGASVLTAIFQVKLCQLIPFRFFLLHLFWNITFGDYWNGFFFMGQMYCHPVFMVSAMKGCKALTLTSGLASSCLHPQLDS